ncbi:uncharacterized protein METZ01_LOCUS273425, partial [marine metagenome]
RPRSGEITCSGPTCRAIPAWYCPTALIKKVHPPASVLWEIYTGMVKWWLWLMPSSVLRTGIKSIRENLFPI